MQGLTNAKHKQVVIDALSIGKYPRSHNEIKRTQGKKSPTSPIIRVQKTIRCVVNYQPAGLHKRITNLGADELEATFLQRLAHGFRFVAF